MNKDIKYCILMIIAKCYVLSIKEGNSIILQNGIRPSFVYESVHYPCIVNIEKNLNLGEEGYVRLRIVGTDKLENLIKEKKSFELKGGKQIIAKGKIIEITHEDKKQHQL